MVKRKKNPEEGKGPEWDRGFGDAAKGIWARSDAKKAEGKRLAEANRAHVEKMVREGRYGASTPTLNMIKALKMHSWQNTVADWQRLFEAEMIVKLARAKKRKPSSSRLPHEEHGKYRRNPGHSAPAPNMTSARELMLYITNDRQLYTQQTLSIIKNIQRKLKSGKFDKAKVQKLWMSLADAGSIKYTREHGSAGDRNLFDVPTRWATAKLLHEEYEEEIGEVEGRRSNPSSRKAWTDTAFVLVRGSDHAVWCKGFAGGKNHWSQKSSPSSWQAGMKGVPVPFTYATNKQAGIAAYKLSDIYRGERIKIMPWRKFVERASDNWSHTGNLD